MNSKQNSIIIFLIFTFLSIIQINNSELIQSQNYDNSMQKSSRSESIVKEEGRASGGANPLGNFGSFFGEFWQTLYINRGFNSSFVLLLPLFTVTIPGYGTGLQNQTPLSALNIGNLAIVGILVFGSIAIWAPILYPDFSGIYTGRTNKFRDFNGWEALTETLAKRLLDLTEQILGRALEAEDKHTKVNNFLMSRLHSIVDLIMDFLETILEDLPKYPGLNPEDCIKRCICESHKRSDRYGWVGKVFRFLFRPHREVTKKYKTITKYRLAANYGSKEKSINCGQRYKECQLNFPHIIHYMLEFLF